MAATTKLFEKQFLLFLGTGTKEKFERKFYYEILIKNYNFSIPQQKTIFLKDLQAVAKECDKWDIQIIGVETSMDSKYPLTTKVIEKHPDLPGNSWIETCICEFNEMHVYQDLIVYIDIPENKIELLANIFSINI